MWYIAMYHILADRLHEQIAHMVARAVAVRWQRPESTDTDTTGAEHKRQVGAFTISISALGSQVPDWVSASNHCAVAEVALPSILEAARALPRTACKSTDATQRMHHRRDKPHPMKLVCTVMHNAMTNLSSPNSWWPCCRQCASSLPAQPAARGLSVPAGDRHAASCKPSPGQACKAATGALVLSLSQAVECSLN